MTEDSSGAGNKAKVSGTVQALDRGLRVLDALAAASRDASLAQLAAQFPWHKTTTLRMLNTLVQHGHVEQDRETQRYRLALGIMRLSRALDRRIGLRQAGHTPLRSLAARTRETAHIAVMDGDEVVVLEQAETSEQIRMITDVGMRMPCHCTALGKVLLAHLPIDELESYLENVRLRRFTERTVTEVEPLQVGLEQVREQGYAYDDREYDPGMCCLAAPVRDRDRRVVASVGVSGPTHRMQSLQDLDEIVVAVRETAAVISQGLGCQPR